MWVGVRVRVGVCVRVCVGGCACACGCMCAAPTICCWHPLDFVRCLLATGEHMQWSREVLIAAPQEDTRVTSVHRRGTHTDDATSKRLCRGHQREDASARNDKQSHFTRVNKATRAKQKQSSQILFTLVSSTNAVHSLLAVPRMKGCTIGI